MAAMLAMVMVLASPALADHTWWHDKDFDKDFPWWKFFDDRDKDRDDAAALEITQEFEQEAESGDVDLSYALVTPATTPTSARRPCSLATPATCRTLRASCRLTPRPTT